MQKFYYFYITRKINLFTKRTERKAEETLHILITEAMEIFSTEKIIGIRRKVMDDRLDSFRVKIFCFRFKSQR